MDDADEPESDVEADPAVHASFTSTGKIPLLLPVRSQSGDARRGAPVSNSLPLSKKKSGIPVPSSRSAITSTRPAPATTSTTTTSKPSAFETQARVAASPLTKLDRRFVMSPARNRRVSSRSVGLGSSPLKVDTSRSGRSHARSPSLEPKEESDDDSGAKAILSEVQSAIQNRPRGKGRVQQLPTPTSPPSSTTSKKRKQFAGDESGDDEPGWLERPSRRARLSLEDEMRFAEAEESKAAAMDLFEERAEYTGSGSYKVRESRSGFLKGGGAGGRPVWSAAD